MEGFKELFQDVITVVFVWIFLSIVLEEVFNSIFDWKIYKNHLDGKGMKFPIKMGFILLVVNLYPGMDIFHKLLKAMELHGTSGSMSYLTTALLLSGGSGTAFKVLRKLREAKKELEKESQL